MPSPLLLAAILASAPVGDAESRLRCAVPADAPVFSREVGAVPSVRRGQTVVARTGKPAPALVVEGWKPATAPLPAVLAELGREAGFAVVGAEGLGPVSWTRDRATLTEALDGLTAQVGASWSFSSGVVRVVRTPAVSTVSASVSLPSNRDAALALVDALRGYDAQGVTISDSGVSFSTSPSGFQRIQSGLSGVSEVYAFDVSFVSGRPSAGRYAWSSLAGSSVVADGAGGRMLLGEDGGEALSRFLASGGDVRTGGSQTVAGPSGWALVVPQSQCGIGSIEITLKPKRVGDGFSLQLSGFGPSAVEIPMIALGQTLVLARRDPVDGWIDMVSVRPRVLSVR